MSSFTQVSASTWIQNLPPVYRTRFKELGFTNVAAGLWRFVDLSTDCHVGAHYRSKAELMANMERYAEVFGCDM